MRHLMLLSGKDSLATALVQTKRAPTLPYEYVFTDVRMELPETYAWLDRVEKKTGWPIVRIGVDLRARIEHYGGFLPSRIARYCTKEGKIEPMEEYIGKDDCTVYYGLRADEVRAGYVPFGKPNITPCYPLRDLSVTLSEVYALLDEQDMMPPDFRWERLYDAAVKALRPSWGTEWQERLTRAELAVLFAGRTRANCFQCFFQRRYEYVWLYETHRDLFDEALSYERDDYTWRKEFPMRNILDGATRERLFKKRLKEVLRIIVRRMQGNLFDGETDNELAMTSCGLLCGK